ncbi:lytic transglycosylase domain-containing protein [uncultured Finegoldia sp.]|uniref:lytic transglycosylase domain-containing protein n=1 Tax=uncultured Finegoldia sp. TaxID=328009 RepID=UPI0026372810|nr:lytic transglycosylase domain-containing protein [uncultured Finegoldia sp.]
MKFIKRFFLTIITIFVILFLVGFGVSAYSTMSRPVKYVDLVNTYSKQYNVDPLLVMSVIKVESDFNPDVQSKAGALGLMQLMPDTAESINNMRNTHFTVDDLKKPDKNIEMGTAYLSYLLHHFKNHDLAIAAYNGGIGNVKEWLANESFSKDGKTLSDIPSSETKYYVVKVDNQYKIYKIFYEDTVLKDNMHKDFKVWAKNYFKLIKNIINKY